MAEPTEQAYIARITDRLRRDHPDPKMRAKLYDDGGLPEYVQTLMREVEDQAVLARVIAGVRAAEDGQPAE